MDKIFIAGHNGLVGRSLVRQLSGQRSATLILRDRSQLDLSNQKSVDDFFREQRPSKVYLAAAKVGGIQANIRYPREFIAENLKIQTNVIDAAWRFGTKKLLFVGSSCIYPKFAPQPLKPEHLLSGELEISNRAYAVAKIAGIEMCRAYRAQYGFDAICAMATNLYGPHDLFDIHKSHVIPALMLRVDQAKRRGENVVKFLGTGVAMRDFLYVDDFASALILLMERYSSPEPINVGSGLEVSIQHLARLILESMSFRGTHEFDQVLTDGTPRKCLDVLPMRGLGWTPQMSLREGISATIAWARQVGILGA